MDISEQLIHTTVRIESIDRQNRPHSGTGFFFNFPVEGNVQVRVIVTNRHVLESMQSISISLTVADSQDAPLYGQHERIQISDIQGAVLYHNDPAVDLAIIFAEVIFGVMRRMGKPAFTRAVGTDLLPSDELIKSMMAFEDVVMVGYPNGLWDAVNNLPLIRRGYTATPFVRDFNGRKEFVIDAACFPGSSGSPVYLYNQGSYSTPTDVVLGGSRVALLGILFGGPQVTVQGQIVIAAIPTGMQAMPVTVSHHPNHLGYCIKSSRILDFEPVVRERALAEIRSSSIANEST